jgi:ABC-2 type transport system permease protein
MLGRIFAIIRKEFIHIRRDRRTLAIVFLIPVVQLILMGYAATTDVKHLATAVLDRDRTRQSRELIEAYRASNYFDIRLYVADEEEIRRLLDRGDVRAGLIIPPGYGENILRGQRAEVGFIIDGSDPSVASTAFSAAQAVGQAHSTQLLEERLHIRLESLMGVDVRPRVWYNPEMRSANFMIPGLIALILTLMTIILTALAIVREREHGTMEQLIVTPIRPVELVIGKVAPYILIAFFNLLEILTIGVLWFRVPVRGDVMLLMGLAVLFLVTSLSLGILISSVSKSQQEAMMLSWFYFVPSIFLAGYFFPIDAMPAALQFISRLVPLTYIIIIVRGIILKGVGLESLADPVTVVTIIGVALLLLATARFRKQLT